MKASSLLATEQGLVTTLDYSSIFTLGRIEIILKYDHSEKAMQTYRFNRFILFLHLIKTLLCQ